MEFQPIVGTACAHCKHRILVDVDGKNCKRCGLAIHRRCAKAHKAECAQRPMVQPSVHDYGEVPPLEWTPRLVALLAVAAFILAFGIGMLSAAPEGASEGRRTMWGWALIVVGILIAATGYVIERARQARRS